MLKKALSFCVILLFFFVMIAPQSFAFFFSKYEKVKPTNGEVAIAIEEVNDGSAHYYTYKHQGQDVKFFVIKSQDGEIRAAFDACDVCYLSKKGYTQDGDYMICNNCGRKFHSNRINIIQGGCNPAPLHRSVRGEQLVIRVNDIIEGKRYF